MSSQLALLRLRLCPSALALLGPLSSRLEILRVRLCLSARFNPGLGTPRPLGLSVAASAGFGPGTTPERRPLHRRPHLPGPFTPPLPTVSVPSFPPHWPLPTLSALLPVCVSGPPSVPIRQQLPHSTVPVPSSCSATPPQPPLLHASPLLPFSISSVPLSELLRLPLSRSDTAGSDCGRQSRLHPFPEARLGFTSVRMHEARRSVRCSIDGLRSTRGSTPLVG